MSEPISEPLWSLMLSTNDCYPGCGCESDRFEMTPLAVTKWVRSAKPSEPGAALGEVRRLIEGIQGGTIGREGLTGQTGVFFRDDSAVVNWLRTWERLLEAASQAGADAVREAEEREELARRFERKGRR